jgi:hypothetical protein
VDIETGLPSDESSQETISEAFIEGTVPLEQEDQEQEEPSLDAPPTGDNPTDPYPSSGN